MITKARIREQLLLATEERLDITTLATSCSAGRLKGKDKIALSLARIINKFKVAKHFEIVITDESLSTEGRRGSSPGKKHLMEST